MTQLLVPVSTIVAGFTPVGDTANHLCIDETTGLCVGADDDTGTYMYGTAVTKTWQGLLTAGASAPGSSGSLIFSMRHRERTPGSVSSITTVQLGSVADGIIASRLAGGPGGSYLKVRYTCTGAEEALMTDWGNMAARISWSVGDPAQMRITAYDCIMPDPAVATGLRGWFHPMWRFT